MCDLSIAHVSMKYWQISLLSVNTVLSNYYSELVKHSPAQYNVYLNIIYIHLIQDDPFKCLYSLF